MTNDSLSTTRFVYHRVPNNLIGSTLYPLNHLKRVLPQVAAAYVTKYHGREALLTRRIPRLNCLWNDVLMFSPVHPAALKTALAAAGHTRPPHAWFEVDVRHFSPADTAIFEHRVRPCGDFSMDEDQILPFTPQLLDSYTDIPAITHQYYASIPPGQPVLLFFGITHVLYKGTLTIDGFRVIHV